MSLYGGSSNRQTKKVGPSFVTEYFSLRILVLALESNSVAWSYIWVLSTIWVSDLQKLQSHFSEWNYPLVLETQSWNWNSRVFPSGITFPRGNQKRTWGWGPCNGISGLTRRSGEMRLDDPVLSAYDAFLLLMVQLQSSEDVTHLIWIYKPLEPWEMKEKYPGILL